MISTALCLIALIIYYVGIVILPREKRENGFEAIIIGTIMLISLGGFAALLYTVLNIPVTLLSMAGFVGVLDICICGRIIYKKQTTKCVWPLIDGVSLLVLIILVMLAAAKCFGFNLRLNYVGIDSARYFQQAMDVLNQQKVSGEFLTDLLNAMFIAFFQPFLQPVSYYKGFVLADIFVHVLSVAMFYLLVSKINQGRSKWWNSIISLLYFGGYPLYNMSNGGFLHWVDGMLMVMFLFYMTLLLMRQEISHEKGIFGLLLGLFGAICVYPILLLMVAPMLLPEAIIWCKNNFRNMSKKILMLFSGVAVLVIGIAILVVGQRINHSWDSFIYSLKEVDGTIYREPYMDFLFFVPVFICFIGLLHRNKKENRSIGRMLMVAIAFIIVWFVLFINEYIVGYYYYRMYYVMWLIAWLMTTQTIHMMELEHKRSEVIVYGIFFGLILLVSFGNLNEKLWKTSEGFFQKEETVVKNSSLCPLYEYSWDSLWGTHDSAVEEAEFGLYEYVYENYQDEKVPMISSIYTNMHAEWYRGVADQEFEHGIYDERYYSLYRILRNLEIKEVKHIAVLKNEPMYIRYYDEVFSHFETVMENAGTVVYEMPQDGWTTAVKGKEPLTYGERQFFVEITGRKLRVPLVYDMNGIEQAKYFAIYTSGDVDSWIHETLPEEFIPNTYRLNNDDVEYLAVLKNSEIYRQNKEYFDMQNIVYENEAGMLIQHAGDGWMPSEQG